MAWRRLGDKLIFEPSMIYFTDEYMSYSTLMMMVWNIMGRLNKNCQWPQNSTVTGSQAGHRAIEFTELDVDRVGIQNSDVLNNPIKSLIQ